MSTYNENYMRELNKNYSKDNSNIYFDWKKIKSVDYKSFKVISDIFAKDKNNVFWWEEKINEIDSKTFEILDDFYIKDKSSVYYIDFFDWLKKVEWNDVNTFEVIKGKSTSKYDFKYALDKDFIYYNWKQIKNSDSKNFKFLNEYISIDSNQLYYIDLDINKLNILKEVDLKSFKLLWDYIWIDNNNLYYFDFFWNNVEIIKLNKEINIESFILKIIDWWKILFEDKNFIYDKNLNIIERKIFKKNIIILKWILIFCFIFILPNLLSSFLKTQYQENFIENWVTIFFWLLIFHYFGKNFLDIDKNDSLYWETLKRISKNKIEIVKVALWLLVSFISIFIFFTIITFILEYII
jgi:hypothetical protein